MLVNRAGNQLFSSAAFATNQNGHHLGSNASDLFVDFDHLRTFADQLISVVNLRVSRFLNRNWLGHQAACVKRAFHEVLDLGNVQRLGAEFVSTKFHGFDRGVTVVHRSDEDHRHTSVD